MNTLDVPSSWSRNPSLDKMVSGLATIGYVSKMSNLKLSYHYKLHPLSHIRTLLFDKNPMPQVPNKSINVPNMWVKRTAKVLREQNNPHLVDL